MFKSLVRIVFIVGFMWQGLTMKSSANSRVVIKKSESSINYTTFKK